jgi:hypothetical protein
MKIYILTRFSCPNYPPRSFHWDRSTHPHIYNKINYYKWLYDEKRLDERMRIFNAITKPSIESQTYENYEWIFFIGKDLPDKYKKILNEIKKSKLIIINKYEDIEKENFFDQKEFISIRLDDDDAIHPKYLEYIKDFNKENEIITPFYGKHFCLNLDGTFQAENIINQAFIRACGVGSYKKNIYSLGNHSTFYNRFPINFIQDKNMFFVSVGSHTSTNRTFRDKLNIKNYNIDTLFHE